MSPADALYRAVCAAPHDDLPRLVYADWLEENGRAHRAEFIRVQCRLADASPADAEYVDLLEREAELKAILWRELEADRPTLPAGIGWEPEHRGFAERLRFANTYNQPLQPVIDRLAGVNAGVPISGLRGVLAPSELRQLSSSPLATTLTSLHLDSAYARDHYGGVVEVLAEPTTLPSLRRLYVGDDLDADQFRRLTGSPVFAELREFHVGRGSDFRAPNLSSLPLRVVGIAGIGRERTDGGLHHFRPEGMRNVHTLFGVHADRPADNPFQFLEVFPQLARLELHRQPDDLGGLVAPSAIKLAYLTINSKPRPPLPSLSTDSRLNGLRVLELHSAFASAARVWLRSPALVGLRQLTLHESSNGKAPDWFASARCWESLTSFRWSRGTSPPPAPLRWLTDVRAVRLKHLDLKGLVLGDAGAVALASNPSLGNLTRLNLSGCRIGPRGVQALLQSPHLQRLVELNLYANSGGDAVAALADPGVMPELGLADVAANGVSDEVRRRLEHRPAIRAR